VQRTFLEHDRSSLTPSSQSSLMYGQTRYVTHMQRAFLEYDSAFLAAMAAEPKQAGPGRH
jgi:hypothetical protein